MDADNSPASRWHSDLVHERQPAGITHLHNDTVPSIGGDTLWASGYAAYEKLSPDFRKLIDGKYAVYRSAHPYLDKDSVSTFQKLSQVTYVSKLRVVPMQFFRADNDVAHRRTEVRRADTSTHSSASGDGLESTVG